MLSVACLAITEDPWLVRSWTSGRQNSVGKYDHPSDDKITRAARIPTIHRPPPIADKRAFRARHHGLSPLVHLNAGQRPDEVAEVVSAHLEIRVLVVGRAGGRQEHDRLRRHPSAPHPPQPQPRPGRAHRSGQTEPCRRASPRNPRRPGRSDRLSRPSGSRGVSGAMPPSFALPPRIQNMRSKEASALSVESALVALESLTKITRPRRPTSSMRCGRPGKDVMARLDHLRLDPAVPSGRDRRRRHSGRCARPAGLRYDPGGPKPQHLRAPHRALWQEPSDPERNIPDRARGILTLGISRRLVLLRRRPISCSEIVVDSNQRQPQPRQPAAP